MEFCRKCLLPETYPKLQLDNNGVCNVCREYERKFGNYNPKEAHNRLMEKIETIARGNKSVVVTCSGGIDSSYVMYLCRREFKLNVIGANFDNGFVTDTAKRNLDNLSKTLDVPIVKIKPDFGVLYRLYRDFLLRTGDFCTPCCQGCCRAGFIVAKQNSIDTIIHGGVSGSMVEFNVLGMLRHHYERFMHIAGNEYEKSELEIIATPTEQIDEFVLLSLPQYFDWDENDIIETLSREVGWNALPDGRRKHMDCAVAEASDHLLQKKFGFSKKWMLNSAYIRAGKIDYQKGRELIKMQEESLMDEPKEAMEILLRCTGLDKKSVYRLPFYNTEPAWKYL